MATPSNFQLIVESDGRADFDAAMAMCFARHTKATRYEVVDECLMRLMWFGQKGVQLPYTMTVKPATDFVWNWLTTAAIRGNEPDFDGSAYPRGYRVESKSGFSESNVFVEITAVWSEYHK